MTSQIYHHRGRPRVRGCAAKLVILQCWYLQINLVSGEAVCVQISQHAEAERTTSVENKWKKHYHSAMKCICLTCKLPAHLIHPFFHSMNLLLFWLWKICDFTLDELMLPQQQINRSRTRSHSARWHQAEVVHNADFYLSSSSSDKSQLSLYLSYLVLHAAIL